ncbi:MAG: ribonuclease III [Dehalococcoidales bacterium]|nr:ribonuclease III [Dehalococcoidales bacterium]
MPDLTELQKVLGASFQQPGLLTQALTHSSYANENPGIAPASNERLEFLGDAILGLIVAENLYRDFPSLSEGEMTRLRSILVKQETLARVAESIGLGGYLYLGKGEEASGGSAKPANLARALEAVIAAVYLDQGTVVTEQLVLEILDTELRNCLYQGAIIDYKSQLQELLQAKTQQTPVYNLIETQGPDHNKKFTVEVRSGNDVLASGVGRSKKKAETEAARIALGKLNNTFTE